MLLEFLKEKVSLGIPCLLPLLEYLFNLVKVLGLVVHRWIVGQGIGRPDELPQLVLIGHVRDGAFYLCHPLASVGVDVLAK